MVCFLIFNGIYNIPHFFTNESRNRKKLPIPPIAATKIRSLAFSVKITKKDGNRLDFYMFGDIFTEKNKKKRHIMNPQPEKKKTFIMFPSVKDFMREQSGDVKKELNGIVFLLERDGTRKKTKARTCSRSVSFRRETSGYSMSTDSKTGFMPFTDMSRKPRKYPNGKWPSREKH